MKLLVKDAARLLNLSEKTIYRWIKQGSIPAYRLNEQYRFNRAELLEWATSRRLPISPEIFKEEESESSSLPDFTAALRAGGIHYRIGGDDKPAVLHHVVEMMRLPPEVDREFLYEVLLVREALGSTGIGDGIAIPHVRAPIVLHTKEPSVTLCFLREPVEFDAIDGKRVHTLFSLVTHSVRSHLYLLSRLSAALQAPAFRRSVLERLPEPKILAAAALVDSQFAGNGEGESEE